MEGGRSVPLVKDWKDAMTAVNDREALLASLKDSPPRPLLTPLRRVPRHPGALPSPPGVS